MDYPRRVILKGPYLNSDGYEVVYVEEPDTGLKYITPYHRYVWEEYHQRKVPKNCVIHHKDGNKTNNTIENLQVMTRTAHAKHHYNIKRRKAAAARRRKRALERRMKKLK